MRTGVINEQTLRAARANHVFCTDEKHIRAENMVMDKIKGGFSPRSSLARGYAFHPRASDDPRGRDAGRARGAAAARTAAVYPGVVKEQPLRARARANRVFRADEKHIRTENTVMDKSKGGLGWLLYKEPQRCDGRRRGLSRHV